jgi:hypothetical protein
MPPRPWLLPAFGLLSTAAWATPEVSAPPALEPAAQGTTVQITIEATHPPIAADLEPPVAPLAPPPPPPPTVEEAMARISALEARLDRLESAPPPALDGIRPGARVVRADERVEDAVSFGGPLRVLGSVRGNAVAMGSDVIVLSGGQVEGDAISFGGVVRVEPGGEVEGDQLTFDSASLVGGSLGESVATGLFSRVEDLARKIALLFSFAGVGVLVAGIWPSHVSHVSATLRSHPFWYGLAGAILSATLTAGSLLLAVTIIGLPFALLILAILALGWLFGVVAFCQGLGERFPSLLRGQSGWGAFLIGAALLTAVSLLPWVGPVVLLLVGFPAVGAALVTRLGTRRDPDVV